VDNFVVVLLQIYLGTYVPKIIKQSYWENKKGAALFCPTV